MTQEFMLIILWGVISVAIITLVIFLIVTVMNHYKIKSKMADNQKALESLKKENKEKSIEYSKQALDIIRTIIGQTAVLKFRTFSDGKNMELVTQSILREFAKEVSTASYLALNKDNIIFDDAIFTETFFNEYIVETSFMMVKELHTNFIENGGDNY